MNLFTNANTAFTDWVVKASLLREPFVLGDVGVQGGESRSWHRLGDYLVVHGFDAIEQAIEQLRKRTGHVPNRHYHRIAAGNGSREIAALLPSSTVRAFGGAPPPTMPSADFCATIRSPCDDLSPEGHGADLPR